jgi:hypothetical protein
MRGAPSETAGFEYNFAVESIIDRFGHGYLATLRVNWQPKNSSLPIVAQPLYATQANARSTLRLVPLTVTVRG